MNRSLWLMFTVFFFIVTCSSRPPKDPGPTAKVKSKSAESSSVSIESQQLASQQETRFVTEIDFPKGKKVVGKAASEDLKRLYQTAKKSGKISHVQLITWGDQEYPNEKKEELPREQIVLVKNRNEAIEKVLKQQNSDLKVEAYSMAERPSRLKEFLPTEEKKLKESLESSGIPHSGGTMKEPGKASKSIVIFIMEE